MASHQATVNGYLLMPNGCYLLKPDGGKIIINQEVVTTELVTLNTRVRDSMLSLNEREAAKTLKNRDNTLATGTRDPSKTLKNRDNTLTLQDSRD